MAGTVPSICFGLTLLEVFFLLFTNMTMPVRSAPRTGVVNRLLVGPKETILERADFTLQLLMFVTAEKEREMFTIFFLSSFCQLLSP